jgi:dephospho-CoA kinase
VTGGIGSGKTEVLKIIKELGFNVISCDELTHELYQLRSVKKRIKQIFPSAVKGKLFLNVDKAEISKQAFSDEKKYSMLTSFLTELVFTTALKKAKKNRAVTFIEVPLLFEMKKQDFFDGVLIVKRDKNLRIESVKMRSKLSQEEIEKRINRQVDYDSLDTTKYIVISNDSDVNNLKEKVKNTLHALNLI